ncbi:TPA: hypothetical protein G8N36_005531, partial [Salmonella enterica]|nr:hypothetical protein [Salmonella enterica]
MVGAAGCFAGAWSGPAASGGGRCYVVFPYRRGRESAARSGIFSLSTGQAVNRL